MTNETDRASAKSYSKQGSRHSRENMEQGKNLCKYSGGIIYEYDEREDCGYYAKHKRQRVVCIYRLDKNVCNNNKQFCCVVTRNGK